MSSSNINELKELSLQSNNDQGAPNYVINPTYCSYNDQPATAAAAAIDCKEMELETSLHSVVDPTSNDKMYEIVPGDKTSSPPLPPPSTPPRPPSLTGIATSRKTTKNNLYVSRGQIMHHPITSLERNNNKPRNVIEEDASQYKHSNKYLRLTCLSILVVASLFLAIVAVVLVLLLWFGVYVPQPSDASTGTGVPTANYDQNGLVSSSFSSSIPLLPTPTKCLCPTPTDLSSVMTEIEEKSANITELIKDIDEEIIQLQVQSNTTDQKLLSQSNAISSQVSEINSTCHETLVNLTSQNVSGSGLEFDAELRNVGLYSNCIYEYLSNCTMNVNTFNCSTSFHKLQVKGYYNLNLACHVFVKEAGHIPTGDVTYPLLATLHTRTLQGVQENDSQETEDLLDKREVRCDCFIINNYPGAKNDRRHNNVTCNLFRLRCPVINTLQNVLIKTP